MSPRESNAATIESTPRITRRKRRLFIFLALGLVAALFGAVEGVTRLCGYGGYPALMKTIGPVSGGTLVVTDPAGAASYFFANKGRAGSMFENALLMPKPAGTVRIFLCGESAMKGFPQPMALSAGAFLQAMLGDCLPGRTVEVVNLATTAVASFPVMAMLEDAIDYQPDLVIVYCGNNEFYGAYGVASLHSAGRSTAAMRVQRAFRATGVAQVIEAWTAPSQESNQTLMEHVMARSVIPVEDPVRQDAARNLRAHLGGMIRLCKARGVPILVCTLASNERDLAPLGEDDATSLSPEAAEKLAAKLVAMRSTGTAPEAVAAAMRDVLNTHPTSALAHYLLGRALHSMKQYDQAAAEFRRALDLDTMPWRPPRAVQQSILDAAKEGGAALCDVRAAFAAASPGGAIGDELMDDHVHPSLAGQVLMARTWLASISDLGGSIAPPRERMAALPNDEAYRRRLGENVYERYGAAHTVRVLCDIPFYRESNPQAYQRFDGICRALEGTMSPEVLDVARQWQTPAPHRGGIQRPISGMVGRVMLKERNYQEADRLMNVAARSVPPYSSLNVEYVYFMLAARERLKAQLDDADRATALAAIERGQALARFAPLADLQIHRWIGRLYQLRAEQAKAIPHLEAAMPALSGTDLLALDQALVFAYLQTGQSQKASELVKQRLAGGGPFGEAYRRMLQPSATAP
ncbi:MAG: hypothetical protein HBSAPP02_10970 [Phycisphaerae bacterium]|nr:MAG: tetratricopeptide repeat protein [Planctomycetia bacterium]RIK69128.1 MAG: hypothetical protein DCC66_09010 [Planctomycetota bacterium]GJQ26065.1 MAG: hypothetical protein HBSAPP02_10970 [Phycisphaerae bacterium]